MAFLKIINDSGKTIFCYDEPGIPKHLSNFPWKGKNAVIVAKFGSIKPKTNLGVKIFANDLGTARCGFAWTSMKNYLSPLGHVRKS